MLLKTFKQLFYKPKIKNSAWDASGSGRRVMYWQGETGSINNLLSQSLEHLRSRSRDMVRKNPYAANIIDTIVSNSIGTGIKPQSKAKDAEFRKKVQELWLRWTDEPTGPEPAMIMFFIFTSYEPPNARLTII